MAAFIIFTLLSIASIIWYMKPPLRLLPHRVENIGTLEYDALTGKNILVLPEPDYIHLEIKEVRGSEVIPMTKIQLADYLARQEPSWCESFIEYAETQRR